ncbi:helix-turn-helix domain-containing protein [Pseudoflavitalea sp. G-6-1-2]|uniref:helix-turn-helix domain-containing protein n=1 Tax=Pseudoflavitalea sp. G-6-1-2 TaxID=2728841 RepID=UPI00146EA4DE|nr:helix-turn-helix domain-containing protein [Pseudoflavitalea sp. G-6-1-2]NML20014.1 helix-turn-helix domain-containing protein [Pseudoflavitalea sp. G-6-1-2]
MTDKVVGDFLLTRKEAAKYLGKSPGTLAVWHSTNRYNLKLIKRFGRTYYRLTELDAFLENQTKFF